MAQTAVEWIIQQLPPGYRNNRHWYKIIEQAKKMEREQHGDTWLDSAASYYGDDYIGKQQTFDQYYTLTYGTRLQNETN